MDQAFPRRGHSPHDGGSFRPISFGMRAALSAAAAGWDASQGANHPIRS